MKKLGEKIWTDWRYTAAYCVAIVLVAAVINHFYSSEVAKGVAVFTPMMIVFAKWHGDRIRRGEK